MSNIAQLLFIALSIFLLSSCTEIIEGETQNFSSTEYRGSVCFKSLGCDYVIVCLDDGTYVLLEDYFNECQEGDVLKGRLKTQGYEDAFNITQDQLIKIYVEKLDFSREVAIEEWKKACRDVELYKDRGTVCLENDICDYRIVCLNESRYSIVEDFDDSSNEGDIVIGRFQNEGLDYVYNLTQNKKIKINVESVEFLESRAKETWEKECANSESSLERGRVCLKNFDCDYMIVCLDNDKYSIVEDRDDICNEGDIVIGKFESRGASEAYNVTRNRNIRVSVKNWTSSEEEAREQWEEECN